jgi:hypothetical protein
MANEQLTENCSDFEPRLGTTNAQRTTMRLRYQLAQVTSAPKRVATFRI